MASIPSLVPITDLRHDAAAIVSKLGREPVFITQRGRAAAVLVSLEAYEQGERDRALLRALARGDREAQEGRGAALDDVLRDADALLGAE